MENVLSKEKLFLKDDDMCYWEQLHALQQTQKEEYKTTLIRTYVAQQELLRCKSNNRRRRKQIDEIQKNIDKLSNTSADELYNNALQTEITNIYLKYIRIIDFGNENSKKKIKIENLVEKYLSDELNRFANQHQNLSKKELIPSFINSFENKDSDIIKLVGTKCLHMSMGLTIDFNRDAGFISQLEGILNYTDYRQADEIIRSAKVLEDKERYKIAKELFLQNKKMKKSKAYKLSLFNALKKIGYNPDQLMILSQTYDKNATHNLEIDEQLDKVLNTDKSIRANNLKFILGTLPMTALAVSNLWTLISWPISNPIVRNLLIGTAVASGSLCFYSFISYAIKQNKLNKLAEQYDKELNNQKANLKSLVNEELNQNTPESIVLALNETNAKLLADSIINSKTNSNALIYNVIADRSTFFNFYHQDDVSYINYFTENFDIRFDNKMEDAIEINREKHFNEYLRSVSQYCCQCDKNMMVSLINEVPIYYYISKLNVDHDLLIVSDLTSNHTAILKDKNGNISETEFDDSVVFVPYNRNGGIELEQLKGIVFYPNSKTPNEFVSDDAENAFV